MEFCVEWINIEFLLFFICGKVVIYVKEKEKENLLFTQLKNKKWYILVNLLSLFYERNMNPIWHIIKFKTHYYTWF